MSKVICALVFVIICIGISPFLVNAAGVEIPPLCVEGIMFDNELPLAIINGEVVAPGDVINDVAVVKIEMDSVHFEYNGKAFARRIREGCRGGLQTWRRSPQIQSRGMRQSSQSRYVYTDNGGGFEAFFTQHPLMVIGLFFLIFFVIYAYMAITLQIIANKTKTENGWLAWIPIANLYLMCMIADKPAWWMLLCFIPYANIIFIVILWMGIADARGKPAWVGLLTLLPVVQFVVWGYLAFSD